MIAFPVRRSSHRSRLFAPIRLCIGASALLAAVISLPALAADSDLRERALRLVNESRGEHGKGSLRRHAELETAAQRHAEDMLERGYFAHTSPDGTTVLDRFRAAGGSDSLMVAENIGSCGTCSPPATAMQIEDLHAGWMKSTGHRRNILSEDFTRFGFGFAIDRIGGLYAVQTFAGPGSPRAGSGREVRKTVSEAEAAELAVDELNRARQRQGLEAAELSASLTHAANQALADSRSAGGLALRNVRGEAALDRAASSGDGRWRSISTVAGECGGCGAAPTNTDIEHFIGQWLSNPQYSDHLLAPGMLSLGFALAADGEGRKVALALIASP